MLQIKELRVYGWIRAVKSARRSWSVGGSGSIIKMDSFEYGDGTVEMGNRDKKLLKRLLDKDSDERSKFLRFIIAQFEMKAPRYFWQQFDTYRIGVEKGSESTMHTIMKRNLSQEDFVEGMNEEIIGFLNFYINENQFDYVKKHLPEGFLQIRDVSVSYQTLRRMYKQRRHHKLKEWQKFCDELEAFPEAWLLV